MADTTVSTSSGQPGIPASNIRVLLVDDHPPLMESIRDRLLDRPGVEVVGAVTRGREALAAIEALQPTLVVLDCVLPDISGVDVAKEVRRRGWPVRILVLSGFDREDLVRGMVAAGVDGYLLKAEGLAQIVEAVLAVARGEKRYSQDVAAQMALCLAGRQAEELHLTRREEQVLDLVADGKTGQEIAHTLMVSENTVGFHLHNLMGKLGVRHRTQAALWWAKRHIRI